MEYDLSVHKICVPYRLIGRFLGKRNVTLHQCTCMLNIS